MSEALVPAAAEPVVRRGSRRRPAGADRRRRTGCRPAVSGVLRGADREREDAGGVRAGGQGNSSRGARREASAWVAAASREGREEP